MMRRHDHRLLLSWIPQDRADRRARQVACGDVEDFWFDRGEALYVTLEWPDTASMREEAIHWVQAQDAFDCGRVEVQDLDRSVMPPAWHTSEVSIEGGPFEVDGILPAHSEWSEVQ
jgi:hypothetical protein